MGIPRNQQQPFQPHWNFALAAALGNLQTLVWDFETINARIDATGHMYADVPEPLKLIAIIDRFLAEDGWFFQGDIKNLRDMRHELEKHVQPVFESGRNDALIYWESMSQAQQQVEIAEWKIKPIRAEAKAQAPTDATLSQRAWFVEGFCKGWRDQQLRYVAKSIGKEWPVPPP